MELQGVPSLNSLAPPGDLGGRKGDREFYALRWWFATLCWRDEAIWVVGREIGNFMPWGGDLPHFRDYYFVRYRWQAAAGEEWGGDISPLLLTLWLVNPFYDCDCKMCTFQPIRRPTDPQLTNQNLHFESARGSSMQLPAPPMSFLYRQG